MLPMEIPEGTLFPQRELGPAGGATRPPSSALDPGLGVSMGFLSGLGEASAYFAIKGSLPLSSLRSAAEGAEEA